ncbi:MAG: metal ABC transporter permease [Marinilabiliaceae bacterium]|jgi:zinc transport system permease protein|nr:metal ABC transporter permease [Marinilabiliaceae bacterium]
MLENIFEHSYLVKSILAALLGSITAGIAGTYIVSRRMVFLSGGITHASFGGIGLGYFLGMNPVVGAALFGVSSALGIEYLSKRHNLKEDSAIGFLWAFGMALGIIFVYLTPGYTPNLMSYLFGSILTINDYDLLALAILTAVLLIFFIVYYRTILYISFDESYARTFTPHVDKFKYILIVLVSLVIVLNIRIAGVVLVLSLLTIPPNIALLFTTDFRKVIAGAVIAGLTGTLAGLAASWYLDIPTGATVIFTLVFFWLICRLLKGIGNRIKKAHS